MARFGDSQGKAASYRGKKECLYFGLDIQQYYYHIRLDFDSIACAVESARKDNAISTMGSPKSNLLLCLEAICHAYREKIRSYLEITHKGLSDYSETGIPIGLCSSHVLGNWYLRAFDKAIKRLVRPAYYGRYVDDILMVVPTSENPIIPTLEKQAKEDNPVAGFMDRILVKTDILTEPEQDRYEIRTLVGFFFSKESVSFNILTSITQLLDWKNSRRNSKTIVVNSCFYLWIKAIPLWKMLLMICFMPDRLINSGASRE